MRLSRFIQENIEPILQAWEDFARTVQTPTADLDREGLRNHARFILNHVAKDMRAPQTEQEQIDKSHSLHPTATEQTAAQKHAVLRLIDGFTLDQMVSEYRALRSSVLRLWIAQAFTGDPHQVADIVRFNEGVDQALVESITAYGNAVENTRKTVLGVLAHDLRTPLGAILMSADLLAKAQALDDRQHELASQIGTSVRRASQIVNDLLDLARCNLGNGIPVDKKPVDLKSVCQGVLTEVSACYPKAQIVFDAPEHLAGEFDPLRMEQVFTNLITNAIHHGDGLQPIRVALEDHPTGACFTVHNFGEPIPRDAMPYLFNPQGRYSKYAERERGAGGGLGLGLFIAAEIVAGHGGKIEVDSSTESGTVFRAVLPAR